MARSTVGITLWIPAELHKFYGAIALRVSAQGLDAGRLGRVSAQAVMCKYLDDMAWLGAEVVVDRDGEPACSLAITLRLPAVLMAAYRERGAQLGVSGQVLIRARLAFVREQFLTGRR